MRVSSLVLILLVLGACGGDPDSSPGSPDAGQASAAADHFLDTYVTDDGRVLRTDQGNDIVSEGQAYAMLIALLGGRDDLVPTIWAWTAEHLMRDDGLLSFHASEDGAVLGADPASDADVLAAYALLTYDGPGAESVHEDGQALAAAVLEHEVVTDGDGRAVLAAGPWAVEPGIVNPSYLMPGVFAALAELTGDDTWAELAESSVSLVASVTQDGRLLPPDWARLDGSALVAVAEASGTPGDGQYGPDAQRLPLWFAACAGAARELAGHWWSVLKEDDRSSALALSTNGKVRDSAAHPVALLASAAAAKAAGDSAAAEDLTGGARETAEGSPGYYGDAWLALAEAVPGSCS